MGTTQTHDAARQLAERGWAVFPCGREDGKKPLCKWRDESTANPAEDLFDNGANIGIDCGKSGLVVLDLDRKDGRDGLADWESLKTEHRFEDEGALVTETPTGGRHMIFSDPTEGMIGNSDRRLPDGIDVRGNGGYIVVPPSVTPKGSYRWIRDNGDPSPLPAALVRLLLSKPKPQPQLATPSPRRDPETRQHNYALAALNSEADGLARTPKGNRNNSLNTAALKVGSLAWIGAYAESDVRAELRRACLQNGYIAEHGERAFDKTFDSGWGAGMTEPRKIPTENDLDDNPPTTAAQEDRPVVYVADPTEIPPLPEGALIAPSIGTEACPWLDRYLAFSRRWSPRSFDGFHEAVGLWLLSTIAARRVRVHFGKPRFTNLYIMLAGRTTVHAKSSATEIGRQLLRQCGLEFLLASDQATPQAFIRSLARTELPANYDDLDEEMKAWAQMRVAFSAQRGWYFEEFGSGIEAMMRKSGIMADFRGVLRAFDDCPPTFSRETISRGIETVEQPYLALIGNLTPADLRPVAQAGSQLWGDGFLARFAFVTPPEDEVKQGRFPKGQRTTPTELMTPLVEWHKRLGVPRVTVHDVLDSDGDPTGDKRVHASPLPVETLALSDPVGDAYYAYDHGLIEVMEGYGHTDLDGNYGRLGEKALRVAALFASLQGSGAVKLAHFAKAQQTVERWRLYTERIYEQVTRRDKSKREEMEDKALDALKRWQGTEEYPDGMTAAQVGRFLYGYGTNETAMLLDGLVKAGLLVKHKPKRAWTFYVPGVNGLAASDE